MFPIGRPPGLDVVGDMGGQGFERLPVRADASVEGPWRTTPASAVRMDRFKLLHFFEDNRFELYDLLADPSESRDLSSTMPEKTSELRNLLETWWEETGAFIPTEANPLYDPSAGGG